MTPKDAQSYLKDIGVKMVSTHLGLGDTNEEMIAKCAEGGLSYVICPAIGMQPSADAWKQKAEAFTKNGEICKKYGLHYGYHNHAYSFQKCQRYKRTKNIDLKHRPFVGLLRIRYVLERGCGRK